VMLARAGNDVVFGDGGDDLLSDGEGADEVHGGEGDDHVIAAADSANDSYCGDEGEDTLDYSTAILNVVVDIGRGSAEGMEIGRDLISGFERIISGGGDDHLIASSSSIQMTGGDGDDTFEFRMSDDDHQADSVRKITDFTVGDRLIVATYEIRYRQEDQDNADIGDLFDEIYLSAQGEHRPVRFRFEKLDDNELTFVNVQQGDDSEEYYSIELFGHHHLEFTVGIS
jgi:Ca2+-binding RTX toxin-like protein